MRFPFSPVAFPNSQNYACGLQRLSLPKLTLGLATRVSHTVTGSTTSFIKLKF